MMLPDPQSGEVARAGRRHHPGVLPDPKTRSPVRRQVDAAGARNPRFANG